MEPYLLLKWLHILSAVVMVGTGAGTAFFFWMTHRSGERDAIAVVSRIVVRADWLFTTPTVFLQPLTGGLMIWLAGYPLSQVWIAFSIGLFILAGICWLPVVWLQIRMRDLAAAAVAHNRPLPPDYFRYFRIWFALGIPAFTAMILIFYLMVFKVVSL